MHWNDLVRNIKPEQTQFRASLSIRIIYELVYIEYIVNLFRVYDMAWLVESSTLFVTQSKCK